MNCCMRKGSARGPFPPPRKKKRNHFEAEDEDKDEGKEEEFEDWVVAHREYWEKAYATWTMPALNPLSRHYQDNIWNQSLRPRSQDRILYKDFVNPLEGQQGAEIVVDLSDWPICKCGILI